MERGEERRKVEKDCWSSRKVIEGNIWGACEYTDVGAGCQDLDRCEDTCGSLQRHGHMRTDI
eukprot:3835511-Rhodomonas_salina.1